jgi:hypothetical protein
MTTYEKCQAVRRAIVNRAAEVMNYTNWSDEFATKQIREIPEVLAEKIGKINIAELTAPQMDDLGFGQWSEDNPMRLIPLWLFKFLPDEIESECIDGTKSVLKTAEMNNDHRFGCLAYGIWPNDHVDTTTTAALGRAILNLESEAGKMHIEGNSYEIEGGCETCGKPILTGDSYYQWSGDDAVQTCADCGGADEKHEPSIA